MTAPTSEMLAVQLGNTGELDDVRLLVTLDATRIDYANVADPITRRTDL
jgi:hypothetical protein